MPFTISLSGRHGSPRRPLNITMGHAIRYQNNENNQNRAKAQVYRRRQLTLQKHPGGFNHRLTDNKSRKAAVAVPQPVAAPVISKAWNLDWSKPMQQREVRKTNTRPRSVATPKSCKYCKGDGHRIYEVTNGQKTITCSLLIQKEQRSAQAVASKKSARQEEVELKKAEARRRLAAQIVAAQAAEAESEVIEDSDSDASEVEDFPALPTRKNEESISLPHVRISFSDKNEVKHYVKGSPPRMLNHPLAEQAGDTASEMLSHEKQSIINEIAELKEELGELQQAKSGSWADAGDEEDLQAEIAELETRLNQSA